MMDHQIEHEKKLMMPGAGQYETNLSTFGGSRIEGGAPNNFVLMRNDRQVAPFSSTLSRFKSEVPESLVNPLGPNNYDVSVNDLFIICK